MAQDYVVLSDRTENGRIAINKTVLESIVEISIKEIENAAALPLAAFSKPITIKTANNVLDIEANIKVVYGANVNATCELVQNKIYENILYMTGFKVSEVTVNVKGFEI